MSGILLAAAAALAGQRDWRRVTVADGATISSPGQYGFGQAPSPAWGAMNVSTWQGHSIILLRSQSGGTNFEMVLGGILAQGVFNFIEVGLANGQSRFFYPGNATAFNQNIGPNTTQWDWSGLPAGYTWNIGDVGKTLTFGIG